MAPTLGTVAGQVRIDVRQAIAGYAALRAANAQTLYALRSGGAVFNAVGKASIAGGLLIGAGFAKAVSAAAEFERRLDFFGAVSDSTQKEMDAVRAKALQLGRDTIYSANQIADSFVELGKAGVSAGDIIGGVGDAVAHLGAAADIPLAQAATIMLAAVQTFGLGAGKAVHVADLLAGAANASVVEVEDLGVSLKYAGGVAAGLKIPIEDVITALSILGKAGIRGSTAGTSLRQIFIGLTGSTATAVGALKDLGIVTKKGGNEFFDAKGKLKPFSDVIQILADHTKNLTDQQKLVALKDVFNTRALPSIIALLHSGAKGWADMNKEIGKTTAAEVASKRLDNLSGDLEILRGNIETIFITSGAPFQDAIRPIVQQITNLTGAFSSLSPATQRNVAGFLAITAAVLLAVGTLSLVISGVMSAIGVFVKLGVNLRILGKLVLSIGKSLGGLALALATNPFFLAAAAIAAVAVGLYLLYQRSATARKVMDSVWAAIQSGFQSVVSAVSPFVASVVGALQSFWQTLQGLAQQIPGLLSPLVTGLQGVWQSVQGFAQQIPGFFTTLVSGFQSFVSNLSGIGSLFSNFGQVIGVVQEYGSRFLSILLQIGQAFVSYLVPALSIAMGTFKSVFADLLGQLSGVWTQIQSAVGQLVSTFMSQLLPSLQQLWGSVQQLLPALKLVGIVLGALLLAAVLAVAAGLAILIPTLIIIAAKILALAGPVIGLLISALTTVISVVATVASALIGALSGAFTVISGLIHLIVGLVTLDWAQAWEGASQIVSGTWQIITSVISGAVGGVIAIVKGLVNGIINFFTNLYDVLVGHSIIPDMINAIVSWFSRLPGMVLGLIAKFVSSIISSISKLPGAFLKVLSSVGSSVASGFARVVSLGAAGARSLLSAVQRGLSTLAGVFRSAFNAASSAVSGAASSILGVVRGLASNILGALRALPGQMAGIGGSIVSGLAGGIRSAAGSAISAARSLASDVASAAKSFLHVGSPSKVFIGIGQEVVNGFAIGLSQHQRALLAGMQTAKVVTTRISGYLKLFGQPLGVGLTTAMINGINSRVPAIQQAVANVIGSASAAVQRMPAVFRNTGGLITGNFADALLGGTAPDGPAAQQAQKFISTLADDYNNAVQQRADLTSKLKAQNTTIANSTRKAVEIQHDLNVALQGTTTGKGKKRHTTVNRERVRDLRNQLATTNRAIAAQRALAKSYQTQITLINRSKVMSAAVRTQVDNAVIAGAAILDTLSAQREGLATQLDQANKDLEDAINARTSFANSVRSTIESFGALLSLKAPEAVDMSAVDDATRLVESAQARLTRATASYGAQSVQAAQAARDLADAQTAQQAAADAAAIAQQKANSAQAEQTITSAQLVQALQDKLTAARSFVSTIQGLQAAGLNASDLQDLVAAGPEQAAGYAQALLQGGQAAVDAVNATRAQLQTLAQSFGDQTAGWFYDAGVQTAQGILDGLKSQDAALAAQMKAIADGIVAQIKRALGIRSPSTVMRDLFTQVPAGAVLGIASGIADVERQSRALADAAAAHGSKVDWSGKWGTFGGPLAPQAGVTQVAPNQVIHNEPHYELTAITEARPARIMDEFAWSNRVGRLG